jgi:membrane fusion protein, heavy metal efflux system
MIPPLSRRSKTIAIAATVVVVVLSLSLLFFDSRGSARTATLNAGQLEATGEPSVALSSKQLQSLKIEAVGTYAFAVDRDAVGSIDFDENLSVQVFPPNQGKILATLAEVGDNVQKGQVLYTVDSPDLIQAESDLISAAATEQLKGKELARAKVLYGHDSGGVSEREYEQAVSDAQTAEGALKAARSAVLVFGKSDEDIDQIIATRKIDPALVVPSPLTGQVTARNAQPGLLVQPGGSPAPYSVAKLTTKWMLASVLESDSPLYHVGQPVRVSVMAYPGRVFAGTISKISPAVDPNTHRVTVRSEISDPSGELRPGMLADFVIQVGAPVKSTAVPVTSVVREGDGTMTAWVTTDRHRLSQRVVKIGLQQDGRYQVLEGLHPGELVVTEGGVFLSNMLQAPPSD